MADIDAHIQNMVEELTGIEALLEMLDRGIATAKTLISKTQDLARLPRLKYFRMILGEGAQLSPVEKIDQVLHQGNGPQNTFHILKLIPLIEKPS